MPSVENPKPTTKTVHLTARQLLNGASHQTRAIVKRQVERGAREIEAHVEEMVRTAKAVLTEASQAGPSLAGTLNRHADKPELTLEQLESATRTWERMLMTSRRVLHLDEPTAAQATVRVGVMVSVSPAERQPDALADGPVIDAPSSHQPS